MNLACLLQVSTAFEPSIDGIPHQQSSDLGDHPYRSLLLVQCH